MALLAEDGTVHLFQGGDWEPRPFTAEEAAALKRNAVNGAEQAEAQRVGTSWWHASTMSTAAGQWLLEKQVTGGLTAAPGTPAGQLSVTTQADLAQISMDVEGKPTAVLAMPKKVNGARDLIVLLSGQVAPTSLIGASPTTIAVNRTDDVHVSTCAGGVNDCSLRDAIDFANANPGTTINVPAGTYQLTIPTTLEQGNLNGDLDVNASGTTIVGAGAGLTIIQQTVVDRVMDINFSSAANFTFSISGVTITGGQDASGLGGGGFLTGGSANLYTVTNCTFDSNAVNGVATNTPGGAISLRVGGNLSVTGSTFTNNNTATSHHGAISMLPTPHTPTSFSVTNPTFSTNPSSRHAH